MKVCGFMSNSTNNPGSGQPEFGSLDASYRAAGGEAGLRRLCTDFYHFMETLPEAETIRKMHKQDLSVMIDKLTLFLCGWLGGPPQYAAKYGPIHIPRAHQQFVINEPERDAWLLCMSKAIEKQDYSEQFKKYLRTQIAIPAERIRQTAKKH